MQDTLDQLIHKRCEAYRAALAVDFRDSHPATLKWRRHNHAYARMRDQMRLANRPVPARVCENPACRRGDNKRPASLDHLRASARFCSDACRKALQRAA